MEKTIESGKIVSEDAVIKVSSSGHISAYINYAAKLITENNVTHFKILATGNALDKAIRITELVKRRFPNVHQQTKISRTEVVVNTNQTEEEPVKRFISFMEIALSTDESVLDKTSVGYQAPIDQSLVVDMDPSRIIRKRTPIHRAKKVITSPAEEDTAAETGAEDNRRRSIPRKRNRKPRRGLKENDDSQVSPASSDAEKTGVASGGSTLANNDIISRPYRSMSHKGKGKGGFYQGYGKGKGYNNFAKGGYNGSYWNYSGGDFAYRSFKGKGIGRKGKGLRLVEENDY